MIIDDALFVVKRGSEKDVNFHSTPHLEVLISICSDSGLDSISIRARCSRINVSATCQLNQQLPEF